MWVLFHVIFMQQHFHFSLHYLPFIYPSFPGNSDQCICVSITTKRTSHIPSNCHRNGVCIRISSSKFVTIAVMCCVQGAKSSFPSKFLYLENMLENSTVHSCYIPHLNYLLSFQIYWYRQGDLEPKFRQLIFYNSFTILLLCICANLIFHDNKD